MARTFAYLRVSSAGQTTENQIREIEAAGFNAFRDAHHPHNLRYADYWQRDGLLWWPQFGTHIWFFSLQA